MLGTAQAACCFTTSDRIALFTWYSQDNSQYAHMVIEDGTPGGTPDQGSYALLYPVGSQFAHWGLNRGPGGILLWRCSTGAALGTFSTMSAALGSLPDVIPYSSPHQGRAPSKRRHQR